MRMLALLTFALAAHAVDFNSEIRPIFEKACYSCHGARVQMHGLRLDLRAAVVKGGDSGVSSLRLIPRYISGEDKDIKMPPGQPLAPAEIALISRWIAEGARYSSEEAPVAKE